MDKSIGYCLANQKHYFFMTKLLTGNTIKLFFRLNGFWFFFSFSIQHEGNNELKCINYLEFSEEKRNVNIIIRIIIKILIS